MTSRIDFVPSSRLWLRRAASVPAHGLLALIRIYQLTLSPVLPLVLGPGFGCRFHPTCSHYATEAVKTHGAGRGLWLAFRRILRCQPLHPGGFDSVPERRAPVCRAVEPRFSAPPVSLFDLNG